MSKAKSDKVSPDLDTPTDLPQAAVDKISAALNTLLADAFALYLKTKNFHWHVSGPHFRDYHLLLDEQADQIFATTDEIAERVRKVGGLTLHSIGQIARLQRIPDNDADYVDPLDMLAELTAHFAARKGDAARMVLVVSDAAWMTFEPVSFERSASFSNFSPFCSAAMMSLASALSLNFSMNSVAPEKAIWLMYFFISSAVIPMPLSEIVMVFAVESTATFTRRLPRSLA